MKNVVILGSTGSIGRQALDVIRNLPGKYKVVGLAAGKNRELLARQIREFRPEAATLAAQEDLEMLSRELGGNIPELAWGRAGMEDLARMPEADLVVVAVTGATGIYPTIAAVKAGKDVALANKETLVAAGEPVMDLVARQKTRLLPVDSEHSAIWQCLNGENAGSVKKIILTASGGPFRELSKKDLLSVTVDMALKHPNWEMGNKITVDSATLMNKGLEVIEARWLFGVSYSQIEVVVHPQSIVHSAVEFCDGSVIAQMGVPDMRLPIQYALTYPDRIQGSNPVLNLIEVARLTFHQPDLEKFPALSLAYEAGRTGGTMPAVLNAANEVAVEAFTGGRIGFLAITEIVGEVMERHQVLRRPGLDEIMQADRWARKAAREAIEHKN
ncbi:MAG: 1-deoxy-D-xylulose-5-phosphate reductoisomerase [Firmicutes bacterium]|nr:1-deoxy-D-xylulose-5-phosphate reductoisomerase [Bacillota bacterium]